MKRTDYCGLLRESDMGRTVTACGWVLNKRDMGGIIFIDLRDREGTLQVVFQSQNVSPEQFAQAEGLRSQTVIAVTGPIRQRDEETYNPNLVTGTIELMARELEVLSEAEPLPFSLEDHATVREELRLKYRFLDLRRPVMLQTLRFRHKVQKVIEDFLDREGFIQVETPMLTKSTPEGARDYLVPSRVHPGMFYALPQSPQIFKQLLMVGGIDKYYQIARCFRDEDLRADRQPEFTQVDMELSFIEQEDVLVHLEKLFRDVFKNVLNVEFEKPFRRMTWQEAMDVYGSDKPDLRFDLPIIDITEIARACGFSVFRKAAEAGGVVRALCVKGGADFTRSDIEMLTEKAFGYGAQGMAWIMIRPDGEIYSILTKFLSEDDVKAIIRKTKAEAGDFLLFCADKLPVARRTLGGLRLDIADLRGLRRDAYEILFVTDFPEFEWSDEENRWMAMHHPFTMPYPEDLPYLISDPGRVRAQAYDVVLNGVELGSGSIRIHRQDIQKQMFTALGFSDEQIEQRFGFMVGAFKYGTPPHGGFAFGLDRLVMLMVGAESLREVIAFPKIRDASCPMTEAPNVVDAEQLEVLHLMSSDTPDAEHTGAAAHEKSVPKIDVEKVASLAMLSLPESEKAKMAEDMSAIIAFANQLEAVDVTNVPITAHIVPLKNVLREDEVIPSFDRGLMLENARTKTEEYITVPRVVES